MNPTAEQLDHLIGHTANRQLTPDEHAQLRAGIQALRASLAGTGAALRRAPSGAYVTQLQQQAARADRYRAAWHNARRRASWTACILADYRAEAVARRASKNRV